MSSLAGSSLEEEFLQRARIVDVGGVRVPVIAPEDLIVTKLLAGRPKDLEDARTVLIAQGNDLDVSRVHAVLRMIETALDRRDLEPQLDALLRAVGRR
jgi:predicted nucleotidyltransferase